MFKNQTGFTLIEMLIVLTVISVLILLIAPNLGKSNEKIEDNGCKALQAVVQSQVQLYYLEKGNYPTNIDSLISEGFLEEGQKECPNKDKIEVDSKTGEVFID